LKTLFGEEEVMEERKPGRQRSAFDEHGFRKTIDLLLDEMSELYLADSVPWVVGYSGGKDSTAALQLVWLALSKIDEKRRSKPVHVISTDTLVENPVVAAWVTRALETLQRSAIAAGLPISPHRLTPEVTDTFWVNLIGRGYPAPRPKFRWCTERLKIKPSNSFIRNVVRESGEAILVLGTRKAESSVRAHRMQELEKKRVTERLSPNASLPNSLVYSPIENWSNDDVWFFLMQVPNPWGYDNKDLLTMYQGASPDGECPLVVDSSTPSCGDSRFGCWVCTLVDQDKSMQAMIQNDEEKEWMLPLLRLRNELDVTDDRSIRDFRRMSGAVQLFHDRPIPGPYTQTARENWLRKVLEAQQWVRNHGPSHVSQIELITLDELHEIRRIWVLDKHELEDSLPKIYEQTTRQPFRGRTIDENLIFGAEEMDLLRSLTDDRLHFELTRELLDTERRFQGKAHRAGLYDALERTFRRHFYTDEEDATTLARRRRDALEAARQRQDAEQLSLIAKQADPPRSGD
jgi:DNA sulfur modification protein DndC